MAVAPRDFTTRADSFKTKRDTLGAFLRAGSPRVLLTFMSVAVVLRVTLGNWGWGDLVVLGATLVLAGFVEWTIHLLLLHAPKDSFRNRVLKTGVGHRQHHEDPSDVESALLKTPDAILFSLIFIGFTAVWSLPLLWITNQWIVGTGLLHPYLSAVTLAYIGLAHYEWTHLLVHTSYRPKSRYYRRLARNHRLHHFRNENYWLGVTTNSGDRALRTLPRSKSDVPLSETTRTLASADRASGA